MFEFAEFSLLLWYDTICYGLNVYVPAQNSYVEI